MSLPKFQFRNTIKPKAKYAKIWQSFLVNPPAFIKLLDQKTNSIQKWSDTESKKWKHILILGIGGSSLGAQALISALYKSNQHQHSTPTPFFLDNLDPIETSTTLAKLNLKKTLILVITKSGSTLETLTQFFTIKSKLGKSWRKQVVAITDPDEGYLRKLAEKEKLKTFSIPTKVGGRYSVLSLVGLIPSALAGLNINKLLQGAKKVDPKKAFEFAKIHAGEYKRKKNITVFCPYSSQLKKLGEWYAQLLAESIGKSPQVGITPEVSIGATDQHSKLQLWSDGPDDKFFIFLKVNNFKKDFKTSSNKDFNLISNKTFSQILNAEFSATTQALVEKKRALIKIEIPKIDEEALGHLLYFFQLEVTFLGQILGVNPFDQPGVERGKVLARKQLQRN